MPDLNRAWTEFQSAAENMKQNILRAAGETKQTASAASKAAMEKIDAAIKAIKDHLPK